MLIVWPAGGLDNARTASPLCPTGIIVEWRLEASWCARLRRRSLSERAMRAMLVVMGHVVPQQHP